ncbi:hypothetical protein JHD47_06760 [Sulfurimonas sp. SAG-AH-194-L11]|nr:hypothetical protein [Sulfurimonas sp. SAG-AH-194-L11]MDF1877515.1 hypothetical protein [Sulfurimonas sp. SAG-AH-194-L11]
MKLKFFKNYFSIIFVVATLMGVFHHHDNLKPHNDCQICTIQSSIADADTPVEKFYLSTLEQNSEATLTPLFSLTQKELYSTLQARAPPFIS